MLCQSLLYSRVTQFYTHILLFFSIMVYPRGQGIVPVLYIRTLLFVHSTCNSLHLLIPNSQSIHFPPLLPLGNHKSLLYVCEPLSVL